jgi:antitoxin HicB
MRALTYDAYIHEAAPGDWLVRFYDIPEAITQGGSLEEAIASASDGLEAALEGYLELGRAFPARADVRPDEARPGYSVVEVAVPPALAARALLAEAMKSQHLTKVGLAQRMGRDEKVVRRIISGKGASLDLTLEALRAVGIRAALAA